MSGSAAVPQGHASAAERPFSCRMNAWDFVGLTPTLLPVGDGVLLPITDAVVVPELLCVDDAVSVPVDVLVQDAGTSCTQTHAGRFVRMQACRAGADGERRRLLRRRRERGRIYCGIPFVLRGVRTGGACALGCAGIS